MKFKHVRDTLRGKDRRIEELEDALRFILLACETADALAHHWSCSSSAAAVENIQEKCEKALDKQK